MSCADSNCQYCLASDTSNCLQCIVPNAVPLFYTNVDSQFSKGSCTSQCPSNSFIQNQYCYNCYSTCSSCLGPKVADCVGCNTTTVNNVFDSGYCGTQCLAGGIAVANSNTFPVVSTSYCKSTNTSSCNSACGTTCMANSNFCAGPCS